MRPPTTVCIPARWGASRLPGKLARLHRGEPVIRHSVRAAVEAQLGPVVVIADDSRLLTLVADLPARAILWDGAARNGSERIAGALAGGLLGAPGRIVNVQGDAVGVSGEAVRAAAAALDSVPGASLGTIAVPAPDGRSGGRTTVSVRGGRALAFSRDELHDAGRLLLHIGVYSYVPDVLLRIAALPPGPAERAASLEQLRWMEHGETVAVTVLPGQRSLADAVDVAADLA